MILVTMERAQTGGYRLRCAACSRQWTTPTDTTAEQEAREHLETEHSEGEGYYIERIRSTTWHLLDPEDAMRTLCGESTDDHPVLSLRYAHHADCSTCKKLARQRRQQA